MTILGRAKRNLSYGEIIDSDDIVDEPSIAKFYMENSQKEEHMGTDTNRGLFTIRAVDKATDRVVYIEDIVADSEKDALYESNLKDGLKDLGLKKDDVWLVVKEFGQVPPKEKVQTVKVLGQLGKMIVGKKQ